MHFLTALMSFQSRGQIVSAVVLGAGGARPAQLRALQTVNKAVPTAGAPGNPFAPVAGGVWALQSDSCSPCDSL